MIIYEDKNIIVVNKPPGLIVHDAQSGISKSQIPISKQIPNSKFQIPKEKTLADWLLKKYPEIKSVGENPLRPGIVHRLDKDSSGVLIVAKNQSSFEFLKKQFAERKVKKTYIALVVGKLKNKTGIINLPIGRSKTPLRRLASKEARGKLREAITEYKVLESFDIDSTSDVGNGKFTLIEACPKTGRTHQIRAHFKAIGHPLACDKLYSKKPACPFGLSRHFLHAYSLELTLPDGSRNRFEADLPDDLKYVLMELRNI